MGGENYRLRSVIKSGKVIGYLAADGSGLDKDPVRVEIYVSCGNGGSVIILDLCAEDDR